MGDRGRDELVASWARVEAALRAVLADVEVAGEARAWVVEYLGHNELGLAFQTLVEALADDRADIGEFTRGRLERVAREMDIEDEPAWQRLKRRGG